MSSFSRLLALTFFLLILFGDIASAQEKTSKFKDPEDGAFDISQILSSRAGFLPVFVPITEPALGIGLAGGISYFHQRSEEDVEKGLSPSISVAGGLYTANGSWGAFGGHKGIWKNGRIRYTGGGGFASVNIDYYPDNIGLELDPVEFNLKGFGFLQEILFQMGSAPIYIGPNYNFTSVEASIPSSMSEDDLSDLTDKSSTAGLGLVLFFNDIDNEFTPNEGVQARIEAKRYADYFGGDYEYWKLRMEATGLVPAGDSFVFGLHGEGQRSSSDAPFWDQPFISLRGIPAMRYLGPMAVTAEAEIRWDFTSRWSILGFGGAGIVAEDFDGLSDGTSAAAFGAGFRYFLARTFGLRAGLDFARGPEDWAYYITIGNRIL
jgi:Omp85 superfamily domain